MTILFCVLKLNKEEGRREEKREREEGREKGEKGRGKGGEKNQGTEAYAGKYQVNWRIVQEKNVDRENYA